MFCNRMNARNWVAPATAGLLRQSPTLSFRMATDCRAPFAPVGAKSGGSPPVLHSHPLVASVYGNVSVRRDSCSCDRSFVVRGSTDGTGSCLRNLSGPRGYRCFDIGHRPVLQLARIVGRRRARPDHDRDRERLWPRYKEPKGQFLCIFRIGPLCSTSSGFLQTHAREPFRLYASACPRPNPDRVLRGGCMAPVGRQMMSRSPRRPHEEYGWRARSGN